MTYQRMRNRNGLLHRKPDDDPDPYWRSNDALEARIREGGGLHPANMSASMLIGDLNRMERDYLATDGYLSTLADAVTAATDVSQDDVRKVLRYVFLEQP